MENSRNEKKRKKERNDLTLTGLLMEGPWGLTAALRSLEQARPTTASPTDEEKGGVYCRVGIPLTASRVPRASKPLAESFLRCVSIGLVVVAATACSGLSPDWNGTWELNPAKSDIPGPTITVSITPDGVYHNASGGGTASFRCDGKGFAMGTLTVYCTQKSSSNMEITIFRNGSKARTNYWELSPDEKVLTIKSTSFQADGSVKPKESRYTRTSGSTGFAGGWRNMNPLELTPSIWQISLDSHGLHYSFPQEDQHVDAVLDGTDAAVRGPAIPTGSSIALKERGPRELDLTKKLNGQVISVGYLRISADGRSLTESYWSPAWPNEKAVLVYDKQ